MRPRFRLVFLLVTSLALGIFGVILLVFGYEEVEQRGVYILNQLLPVRAARLWNSADNSRLKWTTKCAPIIPGVHAAKWAGGWETPLLRKPVGEDLGPALLALHVFSIPTKASRLRREVIRAHSPLLALPEEFRHLVDFKFVIGYPGEECRGRLNKVLCPGVEEEEREIDEEMKNGDLVRLEGLKGGENMDEGKTWEWIRWVGREGGRESQWVFKCDDDNLPILQNFIPFLLTLDPSIPTYIGQPWLDRSYYFMLGYMYGMNWGVVKTLATASVSIEEIQMPIPEDVRTGELLLSLPPIPHNLQHHFHSPPPHHPTYPPPQLRHHEHEHQHDHEHPHLDFHDGPHPGHSHHHHRHRPNPYVLIPPASRRTGLLRIDIRGYLANFHGVDAYSGDKAFGWHKLKTDALYMEAWERARSDLQKKGREVWRVPRGMEGLARTI